MYWQLLLILTKREIKTRYQGTKIGIFWSVVQPLIQILIIYTVIFAIFPHSEMSFLLLLCSLTVWNAFANSVTRATFAFTGNINLIKKAYFSKELLVYAVLNSTFIYFLLSLLLFLISYLLLHTHENINLLTVLLKTSLFLGSFLWLFIFSGATAFIVAMGSVLFKDTYFIVSSIMPVWFYASAVMFPTSFIPEKYVPFFYLNPIFVIIEQFRYVFFDVAILSIELMFISIFITLLFIYSGFWLFYMYRDQLHDLL